MAHLVYPKVTNYLQVHLFTINFWRTVRFTSTTICIRKRYRVDNLWVVQMAVSIHNLPLNNKQCNNIILDLAYKILNASMSARTVQLFLSTGILSRNRITCIVGTKCSLHISLAAKSRCVSIAMK